MSQHCLAIDIGGTNTKLSIVSTQGNFVSEKLIPTTKFPKFDNFCGELKDEILQAIHQYTILGVGIGCPNYNNQSGRIENPPNLPWGTVEIKKILQDKSPVPIYVEKDAPLAALGEFYFRNHDTNNLAVLTIGTGIGSGFIINGKLHQTPHGYGSEAGHLIVGAKNYLCGCGGLDHLEAYASVSALRKKASESYGKKVTFTELTQLALALDQQAVAIVKEAAYYFAVGISQIINIVGSQKVILAGGGTSLGPLLFQEINKQYKTVCFKTHEKLVIAPSGLPINHGALLGAAALVFQK